MKSAILVGDYGTTLTHPLNGVDKEIVAILDGVFDVTVVTDYAQLARDCQAFDVLIDYMDQWHTKGSDAIAAALVSYVAQGGALLSIHNGILKGVNYELASLQGGVFQMHPPYTYLSYALDAGHAIAKGLQGFDMRLEEEPYLFDMDVFAHDDVFLYQQYGQVKKPAGWTKSFAQGHVCYIAPGHNVITFADPAYRRLLRRCGQWVCDKASRQTLEDTTCTKA